MKKIIDGLILLVSFAGSIFGILSLLTIIGVAEIVPFYKTFEHILLGYVIVVVSMATGIMSFNLFAGRRKSCKKYIVNWCNNLQHNPYNSIVFDFCALPCWKIWCKVQWFYWWFCCTNLWRFSQHFQARVGTISYLYWWNYYGNNFPCSANNYVCENSKIKKIKSF